MKNKSWPSQKFEGFWMWVIGLALLAGCWGADIAVAATAREIDVSVDVALENFEKDVAGSKPFLAGAKGLLVFPKVIKAGVGFGGEYGEGALRIGGKTVDYYNTMAASFGLQFGAQAKTIVIVFLNEDALKGFRNSDGWKVGVDGSVAVQTAPHPLPDTAGPPCRATGADYRGVLAPRQPGPHRRPLGQGG